MRNTPENTRYFKVLMTPFVAAIIMVFSLPTYAAELKEGDSVAAGGSFSYYVSGDMKDALAQMYPEGSVGGQCGDFGANVMGKPLFKNGTGGLGSFSFKLTLADPLAGSEGHPILVGDAIVQDMKNATGHFAVINAIRKDARGRVSYVLTESNWKKDGKVTNARVLFADDPSIKGIVRGGGKAEGQVIRRYDDRLAFPAAKNAAEMNAAGYIRSAIQDVATSSPEAVGAIRDATQKMLDAGEIAGAVNSLLPLVSDRALAARLAVSLKSLQPKLAAAKTFPAAAPKTAALK